MAPDLGDRLERLYRRLNRRVYVHPDPLEIVYRYETPRDMEIAGLLSATLAYGRVTQILASVESALGRMDPHGIGPALALAETGEHRLSASFEGFRHRFTPGREVGDLLIAARRALWEHGSLEALFRAGIRPDDGTVLPALTRFVESLRGYAGGPDACPTLLSSPTDGSACKRLNLYLRWMLRHDTVDPGPWTCASTSRLVVPLDTHMYRIGRALGLTTRATPGLRTAVEITEGFAAFSPRDPVRYDFCLTRLGINPSCRDDDLLQLIGAKPLRVPPRIAKPVSATPRSSRAAPGRGRRRS